MSPAPEVTTTKRKKYSFPSDIYTALLGLSALVLTGTIILVCLKGLSIFGEIFKVVKP